ncbi:hypothetical protein D3C81_1630260 [compost metagenome]
MPDKLVRLLPVRRMQVNARGNRAGLTEQKIDFGIGLHPVLRGAGGGARQPGEHVDVARLADGLMGDFDQVALILRTDDLRHGDAGAGQCLHPLQLGTQRGFAVIAIAVDAQGDPLAIVAVGGEHRVLAKLHQFNVGELAVPLLQGMARQFVQAGHLLVVWQGVEFSHGRASNRAQGVVQGVDKQVGVIAAEHQRRA